MSDIKFVSLLIFILIFFIIWIFKDNIKKISLTHPTMGEWLFEMDNKKKILTSDTRSILKKLPDTYLWALLDFTKNNPLRKGKEGLYINKLNPLQKYLYKNMIDLDLVKRDNSEIVPTKEGKEIINLLSTVDF